MIPIISSKYNYKAATRPQGKAKAKRDLSSGGSQAVYNDDDTYNSLFILVIGICITVQNNYEKRRATRRLQR